MVEGTAFQWRTQFLLILVQPCNRDGISQLDIRLQEINVLTHWSSAYSVYILLSFPPPCMILNLLLTSFSWLFPIPYNARSCLLHHCLILFLLLICVCFFPLSPSLFIASFPSTSSLFPTLFWSHGRDIPLSLSHYLNSSMGAMKYKKNNSSNHFLCLATEYSRAVTAEKISLSLQVPSRDHHWYMGH